MKKGWDYHLAVWVTLLALLFGFVMLNKWSLTAALIFNGATYIWAWFAYDRVVLGKWAWQKT